MPMEFNGSYYYPDKWDSLTFSLIQKEEAFKGQWEEDEKRILLLAQNFIENHFGNNSELTFLDAGCGDGRLLPYFSKYFTKIMAIEPDGSRLKEAIKNAQINQINNKTTFALSAAEKFNSNYKFNVILCSHVLQHVHTELIPLIIKNFSELLENNGVLIITTNYSKSNSDIFVKQFLKDKILCEEIITLENFNSLNVNSENILPIHFFAQQTITNFLEVNNFRTKLIEPYHNSRDVLVLSIKR